MKVIYFALLVMNSTSFASEVEEWAKQVTSSPEARQKAADIESVANKILQVGKSCDNAPEKYVALLPLDRAGNDFERVSRETLYGPTNDYAEGKGPCGDTWYYGNPSLASSEVIRSIYTSSKILEKNKLMCLAKWMDFLTIWSSYKMVLPTFLCLERV